MRNISFAKYGTTLLTLLDILEIIKHVTIVHYFQHQIRFDTNRYGNKTIRNVVCVIN